MGIRDRLWLTAIISHPDSNPDITGAPLSRALLCGTCGMWSFMTKSQGALSREWSEGSEEISRRSSRSTRDDQWGLLFPPAPS